VVGVEGGIGARDDDDLVLSGCVDEDAGDAAGNFRIASDADNIHPRRREVLDQYLSLGIVTRASNHLDRSAQARDAVSLVGAFATRKNSEVASEEGFARNRKPRKIDHQVGIQASDDNNGRGHLVIARDARVQAATAAVCR
jgi:hypothetical protein